MTPLATSRHLAARMGRWSASHWKTATFGWLGFVALFARPRRPARDEEPRREQGRCRRVGPRAGCPRGRVQAVGERERFDPELVGRRRRAGVPAGGRGRRDDAACAGRRQGRRLAARRRARAVSSLPTATRRSSSSSCAGRTWLSRTSACSTSRRRSRACSAHIRPSRSARSGEASVDQALTRRQRTTSRRPRLTLGPGHARDPARRLRRARRRRACRCCSR